MNQALKKISGVFLTTLCLACNTKPSSEDVIARVNGSPIRVKDYATLFETFKPKELSLVGREKAEMKNLVIKTLIRRMVIVTEAQKRNIQMTEKEIAEGIEKFKAGYTSAADFERSLLEQMVDEQDWKEHIVQNLTIEKMFESTPDAKQEAPSLQEAYDYYEKNAPLFHREAAAKALHLVVSEQPLAEDLRKKIIANPAKFVELAKQYSIGPEAKIESAEAAAQIVIEKGTMPDPIDSFLFQEKKIGQISPVITSPYGFHIFKILSIRPSLNLDFEQVKSQIFNRLAQERKQGWILKTEERLLRSALIEYNRPLIEKL